MPHNRYRGLFKAAPTPSAIPPRFSITDGQSFLHALAEASAQHRVSRTDTGSVLDSTVEGGSYFSITPAGSRDELEDQIDRLEDAFEEHEGRPPSDRDDSFWQAVNELIDAYDGPDLGDAEDVLGGLS